MGASAKEYNKIEVKNNMHLDNNDEEVEVIKVDKKDLKPVVATQPKKANKNLIGRLVSGVVGPEGASGIGEYINEEIIKPAIKNAILDTATSGLNVIVDSITSGIQMAIFGEKGRPVNRYGSASRYRGYGNPSGGYNNRTNYTSRYTSQQPEPVTDRTRTVGRSSRHGVDEYVIEDRYDAAEVLTQLTEAADNYNSVSIADYYDLIGVASVYTDNDYGWTMDSIVRATIVTVRGGYVIKFPPVEVI